MAAAEAKDEPIRREPASSPASKRPAGDDLLPSRLEDLSEVGYNSHSYRFTDGEIRWLRRFCLRLSETLDRPVAHNTLIRTLFRLADSEWRASPDANRILDLLTELLP